MLVGYGDEDGVDYYFVKNSWGPEWGIEGFGKIECSKLISIRYPVGPTYWSPAP